MDSETIKQLLSRIAVDDSEAFTKFYEYYYHRIYKISSYFSKSFIIREEIVADVFYNVWQSRKKLQETENMDAYLYTSTRNRALYYINQSVKHPISGLDDLPISLVSHHETPESYTITEELKQNIKEAIAELPERCKLIFLLAKEEGLKYKEIARVLNISEKTVNAQMVTALKRLGDTLKKYISIFF